jgi:hypothetical protein
VATKEELEQRVRDDYEYYLGRELLVSTLDAFCEETGNSEQLKFDPPIRVRVEVTPDYDLFRYIYDWLDPIWNVEPREKRPKLEGCTSFWVYGFSYNRNGRVEVSVTDWTPNF